MINFLGLDIEDDKDAEYFYRYTDDRYSNGVDQFDDPLPGYNLRLLLSQYRVIKRTPKGAWINNYGEKKFVLLTARKRYACPTKEEALECFIFRKKRQLSILSSKVRQVEQAIELAGHGVDGRLSSYMS